MQTFNEKKFRELILYIADRCEYDPHFGALKLNKILFYSDFLAYATTGNAITGADYVALELGPAPRLLAPIREDMEEDKDILVRKKEVFGHVQTRVVPRRKSDLSQFSAEEISLVDGVIGVLKPLTGTEASDLTHLEYGWRIAPRKTSIPYETVFVSHLGATQDDVERAEELATQHGW